MLATMNGRKHQGISKTHALWQHWNRTGPGTNTTVYKWAPFHTVYNVYLLTEAPWLLVVQMIWTHGFYWRPCLACIRDLASIQTYRLDPYLLSNVNHVTMLNYAAWLSDYWSQEVSQYQHTLVVAISSLPTDIQLSVTHRGHGIVTVASPFKEFEHETVSLLKVVIRRFHSA